MTTTPFILDAREFGSGESTIVLLGSLGSNHDMWLPQMDALSRDARVISLEHRGHGNSPIALDVPTVADLAADVLATLDRLNVAEFSVAGLSLGGAVAQYLAANFPERVRSVVLLCTSPKFGESSGWVERAQTARSQGVPSLADAIVDRWFSAEFLADHPASRDYFVRMICTTSDEGYAQCCEALASWDFSSDLSRIEQPVLTIAGDEDPATTPETLQLIADGVSNGQAEVLSPAGHLPTIEQAAEVNRLLREHFLN
ncbi:3-oxoadipate enol-lactonase [Corynebacterium sp. H113]|uniref:3-oxoadipate enol-lactonase n=1 Tax=Corynebacterium sp. H113 TaxID=3133419 RepID=UPI003094D5EF